MRASVCILSPSSSEPGKAQKSRLMYIQKMAHPKVKSPETKIQQYQINNYTLLKETEIMKTLHIACPIISERPTQMDIQRLTRGPNQCLCFVYTLCFSHSSVFRFFPSFTSLSFVLIRIYLYIKSFICARKWIARGLISEKCLYLQYVIYLFCLN